MYVCMRVYHDDNNKCSIICFIPAHLHFAHNTAIYTHNNTVPVVTQSFTIVVNSSETSLLDRG